jgi:hypothetical protein
MHVKQATPRGNFITSPVAPHSLAGGQTPTRHHRVVGTLDAVSLAPPVDVPDTDVSGGGSVLVGLKQPPTSMQHVSA